MAMELSERTNRRAESKYALERMKVSGRFLGGALAGLTLTSRQAVGSVARNAQYGELLSRQPEAVHFCAVCLELSSGELTRSEW